MFNIIKCHNVYFMSVHPKLHISRFCGQMCGRLLYIFFKARPHLCYIFCDAPNSIHIFSFCAPCYIYCVYSVNCNILDHYMFILSYDFLFHILYLLLRKSWKYHKLGKKSGTVMKEIIAKYTIIEVHKRCLLFVHYDTFVCYITRVFLMSYVFVVS